jgi:hypothetical protein
MLQWLLSHLNCRKLDRRQGKPFIFFCMALNLVILTILYDLCWLSAQFCYTYRYMYGRLKAIRKSRTGVSLGKCLTAWRTLFCSRCNFKRWVWICSSEEGRSMFLRNIGIRQQVHTVSHFRSPQYEQSPP